LPGGTYGYAFGFIIEEGIMSDVWTYREATWAQDITGYDVEATDGSIGAVDEATNDTSGGYIVVDTGFWIFGKKRLIPAGAITIVDDSDRRVTVNMTKDQIKDAPDYDSSTWDDDARTRTGDYYGPYAI
jgi:hypothetical protein